MIFLVTCIRCFGACVIAVVAMVVVLAAAFLTAWYLLFGQLDNVAVEAAKVGRIQVRAIHLFRIEVL